MRKRKVLLIGTGGTIASGRSENGLIPELNSQQLLHFIPDICRICHVDCIQLFSLDSTNIHPSHWVSIANIIRENYKEYDGFVISHGTDTMAYSAAALSYLIQGGTKPIVLTGAQKPISFETTDSKRNLRDAFTVAMSDMAGIMLVFNGKMILGTRARKTRSKSFEAFSSINYPYLGIVQDGKIFPYICAKQCQEPVFYDNLNSKVALMKLIPGTDCSVAEYLLKNNDALIIESFGVGGLPAYNSGDYYETLKSGVNSGKTVVLTTQVENEGSDLSVYRVGTAIKRTLPVLEAYDMSTEAVVAKLMWILGQTRAQEKIADLFYTPVACDIMRGKEITTSVCPTPPFTR